MHTSTTRNSNLIWRDAKLYWWHNCYVFSVWCDLRSSHFWKKTGFFSLTAHWTERTVAFHCCISPHKTTDWSPGVTSVPVSKSLCRFSPPPLLQLPGKKRRASSVPKKETTQTEQHMLCALWRKNHVDVVVVAGMATHFTKIKNMCTSCCCCWDGGGKKHVCVCLE